jgi:glycogen synthase
VRNSRVVFGSVLKPLDDVRHYHKLAKSMAKNPNCQIFILARAVNYALPNDQSNISFRQITALQPHLIGRAFAPVRFLMHLFRIRPNKVVVCTHELLLIAFFGKLFLGFELVYDVQENYRLNLKTNATYSRWLAWVLGVQVWFSEFLALYFVDHFWYAEQCYLDELSFDSAKVMVLENKALLVSEVKNVRLDVLPSINMLFSGTVAVENGILECIHLVLELNKLDSRFRLQVVGCCHNETLYRELISKGQEYPDVLEFRISLSPLPYSIMEEAICNAHVGLVAYRPQVNFANKMPTKLYEYLAMGLPMLIHKNEKWSEVCRSLAAAIDADFVSSDFRELAEALSKAIFYPNGNKPDGWCFSM